MIGIIALASWAMPLAAQSTRDRGAAIIFTPPKSDTVSTNLEKLNQKESPFKGMESSIRKPFGLFDTEATRPKMVVPRKYVPQIQQMNQPSMKSILEKTAEEEFIKGENRQNDDPYDPFKSPDYLVDPYKNKPKTALDRYYDRLDAENFARTNKDSSIDLFGKPKDLADNQSMAFGPGARNGQLQVNQPPTTWGRQHTNNNSAESLFPKSTRTDFNEKLQSSRPNNSLTRESRHRETRLDNFKRLLDGNTSTSPDNFNSSLPPPSPVPTVAPNYNLSTAPTPTTRPGYISPATSFTPSRSSSSDYQKQNNSSSFSKTAGVVGAPSRPSGIETFGVSAGGSISTPIAPVQPPKRAPATYNPPTRR